MAKKSKAEGGKDKAKAEIVSTADVEPPRKRKHYHDETIAGAHRSSSRTRTPCRYRACRRSSSTWVSAQRSGTRRSSTPRSTSCALITGQKPVVTRAKKAIATFKLREGMPIGAMVTLRRERMWEFLDRLVSVALPRVRDFRGVSPRALRRQGNYTLGLKEQIIFPEIDYDKIDMIKGMNISFVTTARTDEEGRALLADLGMPFRAGRTQDVAARQTNGSCLSVCEAQPSARSFDSPPQPLQGLRSRARRTTASSSCAAFACGSRTPGRNPRRNQGELVTP